MLFAYKAIDQNGKYIKGTYEAENQEHVLTFLNGLNVTPVSVKEAMNTNIKLVERKPKPKHLGLFCDQFCSLIRSGVTIISALQMLALQTQQKTLKTGIMRMVSGIQEGKTLGASMEESPRAFDETLVNLVKAGEASGSLDSSLERMSQHYEASAKMRAAIRKAITYPIIVMVLAIAIVVLMVIYIIPQFSEMFEEIDIEMPKITVAVVNLSNWSKQNWWVVLICIAVFAVACILFNRSTVGKKFFARMALSIPYLNDLVVKSNSSTLARTMCTLLTAGMPIIDCLDIMSKTVKNYYYQDAIAKVKQGVIEGRPASAVMHEFPDFFPPMFIHMFETGEDTGDLPEMLKKTADYYDLEVQTATDTLMTMIQPAAIILLALIVGVLVWAVFAPMVTLYAQLGDNI